VKFWLNEEGDIEMEVDLPRIIVDKYKGIELFADFKTGIQHQGGFWTDSNGYEMILRKKTYKGLKPQNLYPVTSLIVVGDAD
jgi:hypothetical protein